MDVLLQCSRDCPKYRDWADGKGYCFELDRKVYSWGDCELGRTIDPRDRVTTTIQRSEGEESLRILRGKEIKDSLFG